MGKSAAELKEIRMKNFEKMHSPEAIAKSVETRKRNAAMKRSFQRLARYMLEAEIPDEDAAREELLEHGFDQADYQAAVFWGQLKKAINSADTEAAKYVRDSAGFKPTESMQIGNLDDKPFVELKLDTMSNEELMALIAKGDELNGKPEE